MTAGRPPGPKGDSLGRLRVRLTAWYVGTFATILLLLGVGMFATITHRYDRELDDSLEQTVRELGRVARARGTEAIPGLFDSSEFRFHDRMLFVTTADGQPLAGPPMPTWLPALARDASRRGAARLAVPLETPGVESGRFIRAYAAPIHMPGGTALVAVAAADEIEIEDRYASLIAAFGIAAVAALILVAIGGWLLAHKSTEPVEQTLAQMRRFMADAAHELRTPLAVLRSRAEVTLQNPRSPHEYVSALHGIERESERLGRIIDDLLTLARADAGERAIERGRIALDDVVLEAVEAIRPIAERRPVRLELEGFDEAPIEGDPVLVRQLTLILVDNAIKYTPPGGTVRIGVSVAPTTVTLRVADTGIGVAPAHLPFVFDRFYRADPARRREGGAGASEGVGLGLSIARWIAGAHGARIEFTSQERTGTTVTVVFPRAS